MADELTIPSRVECIDDARRWVSERLRAGGIPEDPIADVELALTEALANVIEHAYEGAPDREIRLGVEVAGDGAAVRVRDWGRAADPGAFVGRDLDDPGEGGYGVFLMQELMDDVQREHPPDGGTLLILVKRREESEHG